VEKLRDKEFEFGKKLACAQSQMKTAIADIQKLTETNNTYADSMTIKQKRIDGLIKSKEE
jgi:hypothetical protein